MTNIRLTRDRLQILEWLSHNFYWECSHAENQFDYFKAVKKFQKNYNECGRAGNPTAEPLEVDAVERNRCAVAGLLWLPF